MNCRKVNSLLSAYMDGELNGVDQLQIRQHLRDCSNCNDEYESLLTTKRLISGLCIKTPPPDLEQKILQRLGQEGKVNVAGADRFRGWRFLNLPLDRRLSFGAICASILVIALVVSGTPSLQGTQPNNAMMAIPSSADTVSDQFSDSMLYYQRLHSAMEESRPLSGGPGITPADWSSAVSSSQ